jgi:hypothetical protein
MPYPITVRVTELPQIVRDEFDEYSAQIAQFLSTEHHSDGTHGDITADSIVVSGTVSITGDITCDDITCDDITCDDITCDRLVASVVTGTSVVVGDGLTFGVNYFITVVSDHVEAVIGASSFDAETSTLIFKDVGIGTDQIILGGGIGPIAEFNVGLSAASGTNAFSGSLSVQNDLNVVDDFSVNTNKFTVDGATGDTDMAGRLVVQCSVTGQNAAILYNTHASGYGPAIKGGGSDAAHYVLYGEDYSGAAAILLNGVGVLRLYNYSAGVAVFDGSGIISSASSITADVTGNLTGDVTGNVSGNAGTVTNGLYTNGVNFGPAAVASITVVNGQITAII